MRLVSKNPLPTPQQVRECITLIRRGAWLHASIGSWQMLSVVGPLEPNSEGRETFHVTTSSQQKLVVSRAVGDRGMRELRLEHVLAAEPVPLFAALLSA